MQGGATRNRVVNWFNRKISWEGGRSIPATADEVPFNDRKDNN